MTDTEKQKQTAAQEEIAKTQRGEKSNNLEDNWAML